MTTPNLSSDQIARKACEIMGVEYSEKYVAYREGSLIREMSVAVARRIVDLAAERDQLLDAAVRLGTALSLQRAINRDVRLLNSKDKEVRVAAYRRILDNGPDIETADAAVDSHPIAAGFMREEKV